MSITIVRELDRKHVNSEIHLAPVTACLVTDGKSFWVVSSVVLKWSGDETLVFEADENGKITKWSEVAGGRGCSREEAISDLEERVSA